MIGYQLIEQGSQMHASLGILISGVALAASMINYYYHGMGSHAGAQDWNNMPIKSWKKMNGKWVQYIHFGKYSDYQLRSEYTYKWIAEEKEMGFIQDEPPAECTTFGSPTMLEFANEILNKDAKEPLKATK